MACTITATGPVALPDSRKSYIELSCVADAEGGAITAGSIPDSGGRFLTEVEVVPGSTCASVGVTIRNSRIGADSNGTSLWALSALDNTKGVSYKGSKDIEVFPLQDSAWTLTTGDIGASGTLKVYLKFSD